MGTFNVSPKDIEVLIADKFAELKKDVSNIADDRSYYSPAIQLRKSFKESASKSVYTQPRRSGDGFPPRQNSLRRDDTYDITSSNGDISISVLSKGHISIWGDTKGKSVYPWVWVDQGTTYRNRFTGNPASILKNYVRRWHEKDRSQFMKTYAINLRKKGWDVAI